MEIVLITNLIVMIIFGLGGFFLAKFKYQSETGLSKEEILSLQNNLAILQTKLDQFSKTLSEKEELLKTKEQENKYLGQNLAVRESELRASLEKSNELSLKMEAQNAEYKSLQTKSIELEKNLAAKMIELKSMEEFSQKQKEEIERINLKFQDDFNKIANQILLNNSSSFNKQTSETLDNILKPLR
ncbi:MAG TPA: hypothetical protein PLF66_24195, partial [Leptospiraceae bacterium]|nr:hypothetical protein [Leptospiraceae bacterium]